MTAAPGQRTTGFRCPTCGGNTAVTETRRQNGGLRRRRLCQTPTCDTKFTTTEVVVSAGHRTTQSGGPMAVVRARDLRQISAIAAAALAGHGGDE